MWAGTSGWQSNKEPERRSQEGFLEEEALE